jgi:hypothetical protein
VIFLNRYVLSLKHENLIQKDWGEKQDSITWKYIMLEFYLQRFLTIRRHSFIYTGNPWSLLEELYGTLWSIQKLFPNVGSCRIPQACHFHCCNIPSPKGGWFVIQSDFLRPTWQYRSHQTTSKPTRMRRIILHISFLACFS